MALFVRQDENRTELQERIAAELQEKARKRALDADRPDGVEDSNYMNGTKQTTSLAGVWIFIAVATVGIIISLMIIGMQA